MCQRQSTKVSQPEFSSTTLLTYRTLPTFPRDVFPKVMSGLRMLRLVLEPSSLDDQSRDSLPSPFYLDLALRPREELFPRTLKAASVYLSSRTSCSLSRKTPRHVPLHLSKP